MCFRVSFEKNLCLGLKTCILNNVTYNYIRNNVLIALVFVMKKIRNKGQKNIEKTF